MGKKPPWLCPLNRGSAHMDPRTFCRPSLCGTSPHMFHGRQIASCSAAAVGSSAHVLRISLCQHTNMTCMKAPPPVLKGPDVLEPAVPAGERSEVALRQRLLAGSLQRPETGVHHEACELQRVT